MTPMFRARAVLPTFAAAGCVLLIAVSLNAKDKHSAKTAPPEDEIEVVAHVPLSGSPISHFFATQHYRRNYLYAEHASGSTVTLVDVTSLKAPAVLAEVPLAVSTRDDLVEATGNAVLVRTGNSSSSPAPSADPQTFRIMSFADPLHPTVKHEFTGVTAMDRDDKRGLIFLANSDGLWILLQRYAMDPEAVKEWEHMMLDAR